MAIPRRLPVRPSGSVPHQPEENEPDKQDENAEKKIVESEVSEGEKGMNVITRRSMIARSKSRISTNQNSNVNVHNNISTTTTSATATATPTKNTMRMSTTKTSTTPKSTATPSSKPNTVSRIGKEKNNYEKVAKVVESKTSLTRKPSTLAKSRTSLLSRPGPAEAILSSSTAASLVKRDTPTRPTTRTKMTTNMITPNATRTTRKNMLSITTTTPTTIPDYIPDPDCDKISSPNPRQRHKTFALSQASPVSKVASLALSTNSTNRIRSTHMSRATATSGSGTTMTPTHNSTLNDNSTAIPSPISLLPVKAAKRTSVYSTSTTTSAVISNATAGGMSRLPRPPSNMFLSSSCNKTTTANVPRSVGMAGLKSKSGSKPSHSFTEPIGNSSRESEENFPESLIGNMRRGGRKSEVVDSRVRKRESQVGMCTLIENGKERLLSQEDELKLELELEPEPEKMELGIKVHEAREATLAKLLGTSSTSGSSIPTPITRRTRSTSGMTPARITNYTPEPMTKIGGVRSGMPAEKARIKKSSDSSTSTTSSVGLCLGSRGGMGLGDRVHGLGLKGTHTERSVSVSGLITTDKSEIRSTPPRSRYLKSIASSKDENEDIPSTDAIGHASESGPDSKERRTFTSMIPSPSVSIGHGRSGPRPGSQTRAIAATILPQPFAPAPRSTSSTFASPSIILNPKPNSTSTRSPSTLPPPPLQQTPQSTRLPKMIRLSHGRSRSQPLDPWSTPMRESSLMENSPSNQSDIDQKLDMGMRSLIAGEEELVGLDVMGDSPLGFRMGGLADVDVDGDDDDDDDDEDDDDAEPKMDVAAEIHIKEPIAAHGDVKLHTVATATNDPSSVRPTLGTGLHLRLNEIIRACEIELLLAAKDRAMRDEMSKRFEAVAELTRLIMGLR